MASDLTESESELFSLLVETETASSSSSTSGGSAGGSLAVLRLLRTPWDTIMDLDLGKPGKNTWENRLPQKIQCNSEDVFVFGVT